MTPEEILQAVVDKKTSAERAAYLDGACGQDAVLRAQVEALLRAHEEAGSFLEQPLFVPSPTTDEPRITEQAGMVIGPYKLLQQIGEGGMGVVWMAEQTQPVQRKVALKVIKPGMDSRQVIGRFEAERQALAMMDHVNIARVFDGGTTEHGRPYFVMELVHGVPITKYCDDNHLTPRERLELFVPVCQAIQHAHQKGIIHRDIKPSNVMVTLYDGKPVPKVIDFGVAKATEQKLTERTLFTQYGTMVGTLEYMSPEQAEMSALGVDTRSDIYSLGVLLYELLTGSTPLTHKRMKEAAYAEILRMIKEEEPPRPSTRLSDSGEALASISANRHTEPAKLTKLVRGELDWIVMKTLEKDRSRRYETAKDFAADVQRYLADEPVLACPPSVGYRVRKFARRNKAGLAVAALVLFFLVLLGSGAGWAWRDRSAREAEAARQQGERQAKARGQVESIFAEVDRLEAEQKWPEALAAARRAEAIVAGGEADAATAERVRERLRDLEFVDRLSRSACGGRCPLNGRSAIKPIWTGSMPRPSAHSEPSSNRYRSSSQLTGSRPDPHSPWCWRRHCKTGPTLVLKQRTTGSPTPSPSG
jgi:eukaryotic-like serine/threonine-protein kinase